MRQRALQLLLQLAMHFSYKPGQKDKTLIGSSMANMMLIKNFIKFCVFLSQDLFKVAFLLPQRESAE
jgi:hypothetical protein